MAALAAVLVAPLAFAELAPPMAVPVAGAAVAIPFTPPVTGPLSCSYRGGQKCGELVTSLPLTVTSLLPICMAAAWKFWNVLLPVVGALMLPTMPIPQCITYHGRSAAVISRMAFMSLLVCSGTRLLEDGTPMSYTRCSLP